MKNLSQLTKQEVHEIIIKAGFNEMPNLEGHLFNLFQTKEIQGKGISEGIKNYLNTNVLGDVSACFDFLRNNNLYNYKRAIDEGNNNIIAITKFYFTDLTWQILTDYMIQKAESNPEHEIYTHEKDTGNYYNVSYYLMAIGESNKPIKSITTDDLDLSKCIYSKWTNEIKSNIKNKQIYIELNENGKEIKSDVIASSEFNIVTDMFQAMAYI